MKNIQSMLTTVAVASLLAACSGQDTGSSGSSIINEAPLPKTVGVPGGNGIGHDAKVMTRNLYLGADLGPAIGASDVPALVAGAGAILRQVTATNFPVRAKGLAAEILGAQPDLVGLQECALWRTGPVSFAPLAPGAPKTATTVRYDFLQLLLDQLNAGEERYRAVAVEEEFDFETPADEVADVATGPFGADINGRLTMRDVILARLDAGVHVSQAEGGHFQNLWGAPVLGAQLPVTRGWVKVDARVRGSGTFRFVSTHLEAFDLRTVHPSIRAQQAGELVAPGGPMDVDVDMPAILVGDLNSDDDTVVPDDQQAYRVLLDAGLAERSTGDPLSCCIESYDLTTGTVAMFDHQVDHVMTNSDAVRLVQSFVTGRSMVNDYWDSDHAGVFSRLRLR